MAHIARVPAARYKAALIHAIVPNRSLLAGCVETRAPQRESNPFLDDVTRHALPIWQRWGDQR